MTASLLHIALISETFPPEINGVANTLGRLCAGLRERGHRLQLV
ncbi:MAG: glycosyltransferase family 1 protein, partial [Pseudomonas sp.]